MAPIGSLPACLVLVAVCLSACLATDVRQCSGQNHEGLSDNVQLTCKKLPCRLKKGTNQHITIKFTPDRDIPDIKNRVTAEVLGVPLPFVGVDGNSVCDKIFTESGEKAECPAKKGTTYVYKDSFPVLEFYPSLRTKVHWALLDVNRDIICFEIPVMIA